MNQNKPNFVAFLKAKLTEYKSGGQTPETPVQPGFNPVQPGSQHGFDPTQQNPAINPMANGIPQDQFQQPQFNNPQPFNPMQPGFNNPAQPGFNPGFDPMQQNPMGNPAQPGFNPAQQTDQFGNPILRDQFGNPINPNFNQPVNPFDPNKSTQGN
jgi:hypothetical protein